MSEIVVRGHHDLGLARAKRLAERMALRLRDDYGGTYAWAGDHLQFERTGASGRVTVKPDAFEVRVEIGFLLSPLRGRIERELGEREGVVVDDDAAGDGAAQDGPHLELGRL